MSPEHVELALRVLVGIAVLVAMGWITLDDWDSGI